MTIRIQGLVRAFRHAREKLRSGISDEERDDFRDGVRQIVRTVEEICASYVVSPGELPAPSRNAYRFLKSIDLDDLPRPRPGTEAPDPIRVPGVVASGEWVSGYLWERHEEVLEGGAARNILLGELRSTVAAIEDICEVEGTSPGGLPIRSRRIYAWMRFLCDESNLDRHAECLVRVHDFVPPDDERSTVSILNTSKLWQRTFDRGAVRLVLSEGFLAAPRELWDDLGGLARTPPSTAARRRIREFAETEEYARVLVEMESWIAPRGSESGLHHDLGASFDRVNGAYFGGGTERPRLVWNEVPTVAKFGHYMPSRDTVMVALVLDDPAVPAFVVDFVVYHELLHKRLGATVRNGRRHVHTAEFRAAERRFARYGEADRFLTALAKRLR